ncbi:MAG: hemerythrin domain-containing protein [Burkholderiales bacterium]|nr:hemerythrin domain-containing protein [Burkholderiales bacterium]
MSVRIIHPVSLSIIHEEHEHLSAVIQSMLYFVRAIESGGKTPELRMFRAMLYYITEYPERVHHPKEDQYLFAKIKERTHQLDAELDALSDQHRHGELLVHRLQDALLRFEFGGPAAFPHFRDLVEQYAHFYYAHMRSEEERIMPVAKQILNDQDWKEVDAAFLENRKMLDEAGERYRYDELFSLIAAITPATMGMADPV